MQSKKLKNVDHVIVLIKRLRLLGLWISSISGPGPWLKVKMESFSASFMTGQYNPIFGDLDRLMQFIFLVNYAANFGFPCYS